MSEKFLDRSEAEAVYAALAATVHAKLEATPDEVALTLALQDEAYELLADVLGYEVEAE